MRIGIRQRYALTIALAAVAVASVVHLFSYGEAIRLADEVEQSSSKSMTRALRRQAEFTARQLANVLTDSLIEPLEQENFERLFNITHSARSLPEVTDVLVYDREGKVIHDGTKEIGSYGDPAPDRLRQRVLNQGETLTKFNDMTIEICVPILTSDRTLGAVRFSMSLAGIKGDIQKLDRELAAINEESAGKHLRNFVGLIVVLFILGTLVGFGIAGHLTKPIQALMVMTRQIAQRNFRPAVPDLRSDELGELATSLQKMAGEIEESMISRSHLEKKVRERTIALEEANRQLNKRDHYRRQFLAEASHELRTPLTIIHGEAQVTARSNDGEIAGYQDCLATIIEQTTAMRSLVDDLLKLARLDHHLTEYEFEPVRVADVVDAADKAAKKLTERTDLRIVSKNEKEDIAVQGDRRKLGQLLLIFVKNSINYSPNGGVINIVSRSHGRVAEILISDQGIGLESLDQARIFDPFYRGKKARQLFPSGSGLGLSIAKTISDAHRGAISVSGRPANGTTVSIKLPLESCA